MARKLAISLAAIVAITASSTLTAAARGMGHMSMGHMGTNHTAHTSFGHFDHGFRFHDRLAFRHRFHGPFFAFAPYAYDDCRVWTPYGWRWSYACYDYEGY